MDDADQANDILERALARYRPLVVERKVRALGCCDACGEDIDPERLQRHPYAVRCVDCQADWERQRR